VVTAIKIRQNERAGPPPQMSALELDADAVIEHQIRSILDRRYLSPRCSDHAGLAGADLIVQELCAQLRPAPRLD
jgi:hypothetical protein